MKTEPADNDTYRTRSKKVQRVKPEPSDDTMPIEIKKEPDVRVKTEPTEDMLKAGLTKSPKQEEPPPVSWDEEEETLVEVRCGTTWACNCQLNILTTIDTSKLKVPVLVYQAS